MPVVETNGVLSGISVGKAMRRQVVGLPNTASIGQGIRMMIRHKVNALLLTEEPLSTAIQQMLIRDVQRLFVHADASRPDHITGVLALSDSARFRSGSCRACAAGRILSVF